METSKGIILLSKLGPEYKIKRDFYIYKKVTKTFCLFFTYDKWINVGLLLYLGLDKYCVEARDDRFCMLIDSFKIPNLITKWTT